MTVYLATWERPLSPTEHAVFCADAVCSLNFTMHVELRGPLTETHLRTALDQAQARHPLLRVRITEEGRDVWFRAGAGALPLRVVDAAPTAVVTEAEREVRTPFDTAAGPLARCVWLRHAPEHSTLLVTFQHVIGDGISGTYLVRDVLEALAGRKLAALPLAESLDGHLPARARGWLGFLGYLKILARFAAWMLRKGVPHAVPAETPADYAQRRAILHFERFEAPLSAALAARARAEGTTVHGALGAAIALASYPDMKRRRTHALFGSPLNMRDRFEPPIGHDIGFYVAMAVSSHRLHDKLDFWTLAREIRQGITFAMDIDMPFFGLTGLAPLLQLLYRLRGGGPRGQRASAQGWAALLTESLALTNIGRVRIDSRYGPCAVTALGFVASLSVLGTNGCTAASIGNTLCLNFVAMEPSVSRATQQRIAARTRAILEAALGQPSGAPPEKIENPMLLTSP